MPIMRDDDSRCAARRCVDHTAQPTYHRMPFVDSHLLPRTHQMPRRRIVSQLIQWEGVIMRSFDVDRDSDAELHFAPLRLTDGHWSSV